MPLDRNFIEDSLSALEENLAFLSSLSERSEEDFLSSREASYSAAYALMICIEAASGIAAHLLSSTGPGSPKGMANTFELLYAAKIIRSIELAANLVKMSRFRNLIVHRYWTVDYATLHEILRNHLGDFKEFARDIVAFLDARGL